MEHHEVLVVGGGNAGISLAARLLRDGATDVAVVEGRDVHRYRPLLNYVAGGQAEMADLERPEREVIPPGCTWIRDEVVAVDPTAGSVGTRDGRTLTWSVLVLCPGLDEDWDATPGLREAYDDGWAGSSFVDDSAPGVWPVLSSLREGSVVFTVPPEPAPCAATALKPLFLACDHWRRAGVLDAFEVRLVLPGRSVTGLGRADERLERQFSTYGIEVLRQSRVTEVDGTDRSVTVRSPEGERTVPGVAFAHVVPHYRAPRWIAASGLAVDSATGLVDVDPGTMRHRRHDPVWALGDVANLGIRPSGGALRKQVDVLAHNLGAAASGTALRRYDGYTVMPITTGRRGLMLVEVDREGRPSPSAPVPDLTRPRLATWLFDRYGLPVVYFHRILRGKV